MPSSYGCLGRQKLVSIVSVKMTNSLTVDYNEINSYLNCIQLKSSRITFLQDKVTPNYSKSKY